MFTNAHLYCRRQMPNGVLIWNFISVSTVKLQFQTSITFRISRLSSRTVNNAFKSTNSVTSHIACWIVDRLSALRSSTNLRCSYARQVTHTSTLYVMLSFHSNLPPITMQSWFALLSVLGPLERISVLLVITSGRRSSTSPTFFRSRTLSRHEWL